MSFEIAIVAGEASGDRHGAALMEALRRESGAQELRFWGIGGVLMREAGLDAVDDSRDWGVIGIGEALMKAPKFLIGNARMKAALHRRHADALILIDCGAFNVPQAECAREIGLGPIIYYIPPSSWRRESQIEGLTRLARLTDLIITPFPWSATNLKNAGANAYFEGHPLLDIVHPSHDPAVFDEALGLDSRRIVITLLPGSRELEIRHILPAMLGAAGEIARRLPGAQFLLALAPNVRRERVERTLRAAQQAGGAASLLHVVSAATGRMMQAATHIKHPVHRLQPRLATNAGTIWGAKSQETGQEWAQRHQLPRPAASAPLAIVENATYDAMARADLVILASGTATLEATILRKPQVIVYRASKIMEYEWRLRKHTLGVRFIGLPNILADRMICPELLQNAANPRAIADQALELLLEPERLMRVKEELGQLVDTFLGEPGVLHRSARRILDEIETPGFGTKMHASE